MTATTASHKRTSKMIDIRDFATVCRGSSAA
jgi:hypothetical protein